jgi:DNA polymerase-3 subunit gamma/tau
MDYQVIARRYRPRRFDEVVGQESAAETLRGGILQGRTAHAYLFSGPRGVGKTSMARIFAKALNCPQAVDRSGPEEGWAIPCDACPACDAIHIGQDIDVVEMDGASHRGIEDIRTIVEGVSRPATRSPYKVYIIDEVHMLTREAFNALLKTLEEPPPHVKFVFATTEAYRIPETVLSRCQRFEFQPIGADSIVRRLGQILELEGREAEDGLLERIAQYGRGALRDAQTLLDQLMTFDEGQLQSVSLERITGRVSDAILGELAAALREGHTAAVLTFWGQAIGGGADPAMVLEQILEVLRVEVRRQVSASEDAPGAGREIPGLDRLLGSIQVLLDVAGKLRHSAYPDLAVEVALLKVARLEEPAELEAVVRGLRELAERPVGGGMAGPAVGRGTDTGGPSGAVKTRAESFPPTGSRRDDSMSPPRWGENSPGVPGRSASGGAPPASNPETGPPVARDAIPAISSQAPVSTTTMVREPPALSGAAPVAVDSPASGESGSGSATPDAVTSVAPGALDEKAFFQLWDQICIELEKQHPEIAPFFKGLMPKVLPDRPGTLRVDFHDEFFQRQMVVPRRQKAFEEVVHQVTQAPWHFVMEYRARSTAPAGGPAAVDGGGSPSVAATRGAARAAPASPPPRDEAARTQDDSSAPITDHPLVQKSLDLFKGRIV